MDEYRPDLAGPASPISPPSPPSAGERIRHVFFSQGSLRSGWRYVLYLILFVAITFLFNRTVNFGIHHLAHKPAKIWSFLVGESFAFIGAVVAALIMGRIEKRRFGAYGLPGRGAFGKDFWAGGIWGLLAITLLMLLIFAFHDFSFGGLVLHGTRLLKFALFWGVLFLLVGLFEEFFFRGYTQFTLTQGMGFWPAAIILSVIFGAVHLGNKGEAFLGALAAACIALFFCLTLRRTGNLWFAVGCHAAWDWGESYLYSVPDSGQITPGHLLNSSFHGSRWITGGTVGPEGSVLVFVVIALLWFTFDRLYPEVKYVTEIAPVRDPVGDAPDLAAAS